MDHIGFLMSTSAAVVASARSAHVTRQQYFGAKFIIYIQNSSFWIQNSSFLIQPCRAIGQLCAASGDRSKCSNSRVNAPSCDLSRNQHSSIGSQDSSIGSQDPWIGNQDSSIENWPARRPRARLHAPDTELDTELDLTGRVCPELHLECRQYRERTWTIPSSTPNRKIIGRFSIENHHFSGAILHHFCVANGKIRRKLSFRLQFSVL